MANVTADQSNAPNIAIGNRVSVRTSGDRVYHIQTDDGGVNNNRLVMQKGNQNGEPTSFSNADFIQPSGDFVQNLGAACAIDSNDLIHVVFYYIDTGHGGSISCRYVTFNTSTDSFGTEEDVATLDNDDSTAYTRIGIAIDANDKPHVFWRDAVSSMGSTTYTNYYSNKTGASWRSRVTISGSTANTIQVHDIIIADPASSVNADRPIVVEHNWFNSTSKPMNVYYGTALDATGFTSATDVSGSSNPANDTKCSMAIDSNEKITIAYVNTADDLKVVEHLNSSAWGTWQTPVTVDTTDNWLDPSIAIDGTNRYILAEDITDNDIALWVDEGSGWSEDTSDDDLRNVGTFVNVKLKWASKNNNSPSDLDYFFEESAGILYNTVQISGVTTNQKDVTFDAVLKKSGLNKDVTFDTALKKLGFNKDVTFDATLVKQYSKDVTFDSILKKLENFKDVTFDVLTKKTGIVKDVTFDTILKKTGLFKDITFDVTLVKQGTKDVTFDAVLKKTEASTETTFDTVLKKPELTKDVTFDTALKKTELNIDVTFDSALQKSGLNKDITFDSILKKSEVFKDVTFDAILEKLGQKDVTFDVVLKSVEKFKDVTFDAVLSTGASNKDVTFDAILKKLGLNKDVTFDVILQKIGLNKDVTFDATLVKQGNKDVTFDAVLKKTETSTETTFDTILKKLENIKDVTFDAVLKKVENIKDVTFDTVTKKTGLNIDITFDSALQKQGQKDVTFDGVLLKNQSKDISFDSILKKLSVFKDVTFDAVLENPLSQNNKETTFDAVLKKLEVFKDVTFDAHLFKERQPTPLKGFKTVGVREPAYYTTKLIVTGDTVDLKRVKISGTTLLNTKLHVIGDTILSLKTKVDGITTLKTLIKTEALTTMIHEMRIYGTTLYTKRENLVGITLKAKNIADIIRANFNVIFDD